MAKKTKLKQSMTLEYLNEHARFLDIVIPYYDEHDENLISFSDGVVTELECDEEFVNPMLDRENKQLKVLIDLQALKVLNWKCDDYLRMWGKIRDEGTYTLMDVDKKPIWQIRGYVPNKLLPPYEEGCGDYLELEIEADGTLVEWRTPLNFVDFIKDGQGPEPVKTNKWYKPEDAFWQIYRKRLTKEELAWLLVRLQRLQKYLEENQ